MSARISPGRTGAAAALLAALVAVVPAIPGSATSLPKRTFLISAAIDETPADAGSAAPVLSGGGTVIAFDTAATNLVPGDVNGSVRDVVVIDMVGGDRRLVSEGANGHSTAPSMSATAGRIAFASEASNLVPGDGNGVPDVFVRDGRGPVALVSVAADGGAANGPSSQPDISDDGRYVAFTSAASNLVPGDSNGVADVFVRDLAANVTTRVSVSSSREQASGRSGGPAISGNGDVVAFESDAPNLAGGDTNRVADVFVHLRGQRVTERVSVDSRGRQQNAAIAAPFRHVVDISRDGRYVVFDSDATNLFRGDSNKRTDVFLRDRRSDRTSLASVNSVNVQANNDTFFPRLSANGRYVTFQSFATNLAPGGAVGEDVFVRDMRAGTTGIATVADDGSARGAEIGGQLLQRPSISSDGRIVAFVSTAANLAPGDVNRAPDVFLRRMDSAEARLARPVKAAKRLPVVHLTADDPRAKRFVCRVDAGRDFPCTSPLRVPAVTEGLHTLTVRAGGPGLMPAADPLTVRVPVDRSGPVALVSRLPRRIGRIDGTARDALSKVTRVDVAVVLRSTVRSNACRVLTKDGFKSRAGKACRKLSWVRAQGTTKWRLALPGRVKGIVYAGARAVDEAGNRGRPSLRVGVAR